jgi:hypothetical protein
MAKGLYFGVGGKARKGKKAYFGVGGKARKIKKMYIGIGGKARLCFSSGLFGKAHARFTETTIPVVLNNPDVANPSTWTVSKKNSSSTTIGSSAYAFGKWFSGYNAPPSGTFDTTLWYSTDGITFTQCPACTIFKDNDGKTNVSTRGGNVSPLINCDGRLFGRSLTITGSSGSQSGGGGTTYVTYVEFDSTGAKIDQATGYNFTYSSVNSGYGYPTGTFSRAYSNMVYHNGCIYHAIHRREKASGEAICYISLEMYDIANKTFTTVASNFFTFHEPTSSANGSPTYSGTASRIHLCGNSILINYNHKMYRYDISTKAITELTTVTTTFCPVFYSRINETTFLDSYSATKRVYSYDGTTLTLVTTHTNNCYVSGQTWCGDRNISLSASRATKTDTTATITFAYTFDGVTYTVDTSMTTPSGALTSYGGNLTSFSINTYLEES